MGDSMLEGALLGAAIGVAIVALLAVIGFTRKPNFTAPPRRHSLVASTAAPEATLAKLRELGRAGNPQKYRVAAEDPARNLIVLADGMSLFSFGAFYPLFVSPNGTGSEVSVGISPRVPQYGPVVSSKLKKITEAVREAVAG